MLLRCALPRAFQHVSRAPARRASVHRASVSVRASADGAPTDPERATALDGALARARRDASTTSDATPREAGAEFDDAWRELDAKVNQYPCARKFQAIGVDDGTFVDDVRDIISKALGGRHVHPENVTKRASSKGKYVSANVTMEMQNCDEVVAVYTALKADRRVLWYL